MNLHCLHGFLGLPSDWEIFARYFKPHRSIAYAIEEFFPAQNSFNANFLNMESSFKTWVHNFHSKIFSVLEVKKEKNILIGYSLGGRLALHCLAQEKVYWDGAIIISANPGLQNEKEKQERIKSDAQWANSFLTEPWESVLNAWNNQGVFSGKKNNILREEKFYNREKIAQVLNEFSLGRQEDLRGTIKKLNIPILWLAGELDAKFSLIAKEMTRLNSNIQCEIIAGAGHRVPWETKEKFMELCVRYINSCIC